MIPRTGQACVSLLLVALTAILPANQVCASPPLSADAALADPGLPPGRVLDIGLQPGGTLQGQVVHSGRNVGEGVVVQLVRLGRNEAVIAEAQTDRQGRFHFAGLSGGVYRIQTTQSVAICRLWTGAAAPPQASSAVLIVQQDEVVRGNLSQIGILGWVAIGVGVAAAIAIPVALANNHEGS